MTDEEKAELEELYENSEWWHNRFNAVQRDYEELKKRNKELEDGFKASTDELCEYATKIDKAIELNQYIIDYGFDYDGFNTIESLKGLIDMLVDYARQVKKILGDKENE